MPSSPACHWPHEECSHGVVSFYGEVVKVGHTSVTVDVLVIAERHPEHPINVKGTKATLTYVALNQDNSKREIPHD